MPLFSIFKSSSCDEASFLENCCKAPKSMKIEPPLPAGYAAWIHRAGWVLYVHEPSKTCSWMHPGKLAQLEARGLKGPGKYGPEMYIWEKNVNRGGHYIIDYGYPPMGKCRASDRPLPQDFKEIDRIGYDAWAAKLAAEMEAHKKEMLEKYKDGPVESKNGFPKEFWEVRKQVMREQGIIPADGPEEMNELDEKVLLD